MPTTFSAIGVLLVFVIPGFVAGRVWEFAYPRTEPSESRLFLEGLSLSCVNYALVSWLLVLIYQKHWYQSVFLLACFSLLILLIFPVLLGFGLVAVSESNCLRRLRSRFGFANPVPTAWDYFFRKSGYCWVLATLKSGHVVAGFFGPNSSASSYPSAEDIYLERLCKLSPEGKIEGLIEYSQGAIIQMDDVELLEFYDLA